MDLSSEYCINKIIEVCEYSSTYHKQYITFSERPSHFPIGASDHMNHSLPLPQINVSRHSIPLTAFILLTILIFSSIPVTVATPLQADHSVLDGVLNRDWETFEDDEIIDLIVQFEDEVTERDRAMLRSLEFTFFEEYKIIAGIHVQGTTESIAQLSHYDRIFWIEFNQHLEYFLDVSTSTIKATDAWQRIVRDADGAEIIGPSGVPVPIDGSGVCIVVADTGIDATHPDLDYQEKVVRNLKKDVNDPFTPWIELPNTDNLFGHGTHVAGISAGNGDASAGERKGVAPGATLIGLGIGDPWETNEVGCFEWVWENSRPDNNPYNIKVMTNSWGYESVDENYRDAVIQASNRLTYENNVIVTFAAGNDGGSGEDIRTNPYGNQPGMICVAATQREGGGMASFSSRGIATETSSWPDAAAPGVEIWAARDTTGFIVNAVAGDSNPYYTAISGTSMATPHMAGVAAVLWQAAPSMKFTKLTSSPVMEDITETTQDDWQEDWSDIHEVELIIELTADYLEPTGSNGVPDTFEIGHHGRKHDYAQGYGQVNVERAVALALTLEELRRIDPDATVDDALLVYEGVMVQGPVSAQGNAIQKSTNRFVEGNSREQVSWFGESIELDEVFYPQENSLFVPETTSHLIIDLNYDSVANLNPQSGFITMGLDKGSGEEIIYLVPSLTDPSHARIIMKITDDTERGRNWTFEVHNVLGTRTEYRVNFKVVFAWSGPEGQEEQYANIDISGIDYFRFAQDVGTDVIPGVEVDYRPEITINQSYYLLANAHNGPGGGGGKGDEDEGIGTAWSMGFALIIILLLLVNLYGIRKGQQERTGQGMEEAGPVIAAVASEVDQDDLTEPSLQDENIEWEDAE